MNDGSVSNSAFDNALRHCLDGSSIRAHEPLAAHTTFRIGGQADWLVMPHTEDEMADVVALCRTHDMPYRVLGAGSNVLVADAGVSGVVIKLADNFSAIQLGEKPSTPTATDAPLHPTANPYNSPTIDTPLHPHIAASKSDKAATPPAARPAEPSSSAPDDAQSSPLHPLMDGGDTNSTLSTPLHPSNLTRESSPCQPCQTLYAQAGATNAAVAEFACEHALSGYEFACGIPGSIGGAAIMNAGAYDGQFSDAAVAVRCLTPDGEVVEIPAAQAEWGYRTSRMMREGLIVLGAYLQLAPGDAPAIRERMDDLQCRRAEKQPLDMPSAGSTFKRPEGHFAGKLIQDAGLQGANVGGAQVSPKHAGFIVNTGSATAADVLSLIAHVQDEVESRFDIRLEPEVRYWE